LSEILTQKEKRKRHPKADVTFKIIAVSLAKLEKSINLLKKFYGAKNVIISPIMKNSGSSGYHCFLNVLDSNGVN